MLEKKGEQFTASYVFEESAKEDKKLCSSWIDNTSKISMLALAIPLVIGTINIGVEIIIGYGSEYISKPRNYQQIVLEAMSSICVIQFINLSILFVFVSMNVKNVLNTLGILQGSYYEFNSTWFIEFGTMIVQTMIMEIPMPHMFPLLVMVITMISRWYDRKFTANKRISRKKL